MNKRASMRDIIFIVVLAFAMVLAGVFAVKVMNVVNEKFQAADAVPAEAKATLSSVNTRLPKWIDGAFLLFYVLMMLLGLFLAMQINTSPVFIPLSIFYFIFLVFISRVFSVIYSRMILSTTLASQASQLSIISYVLPKLPLFSFIFGALIIGIMVVKR
jgi:hypothetical protein